MNKSVAAVVFVAFLIAPVSSFGQQQKLPASSHDGLELRPESEVAAAYVKPGVDFSGYERFMILDAYIAFKKDWLRSQQRSSINRLRSKDIERMKRDMAKLFREVFVEELERKDGYEVVGKADLDVLLLRPAIIDLVVTAPDTSRSSRSYNFAASAGAATLYLEIYDSVSGEILARVIDRQAANDAGSFMQFTNRTTNTAAATRVLSDWARLLREGFDRVHEEGGS